MEPVRTGEERKRLGLTGALIEKKKKKEIVQNPDYVQDFFQTTNKKQNSTCSGVCGKSPAKKIIPDQVPNSKSDGHAVCRG